MAIDKESAPPVSSPFTSTHWTLVLEAARPDAADGQEAFGRLYSEYWYPLYAYVRRRGYSPEEAEDLTQSFFARILEKQGLTDLRRDGGRFRSFLMRSLDNFLANEWDRARAQKRGGGQKLISLHAEEGETRFLALEIPDQTTPESLFEKQWVFTLLENVMARVRAECETAGKAGLFEELRPCLQGERAGPAYRDIARRRGMSEGAVSVTVHRLRHRYGELLREEIARTVSGPDEVDEELRYLKSVLSGESRPKSV